MKKLLKKITRPFRLLRGRFKEPLPIHVYDFEKYCDSFFPLYRLADNDNTRFVLASMIQHLGPNIARASRHYFSVCIYKFLANECAFNFMQKQKLANTESAKREKVNEESAKIVFEAAHEAMNRCPETEAHEAGSKETSIHLV